MVPVASLRPRLHRGGRQLRVEGMVTVAYVLVATIRHSPVALEVNTDRDSPGYLGNTLFVRKLDDSSQHAFAHLLRHGCHDLRGSASRS